MKERNFSLDFFSFFTVLITILVSLVIFWRLHFGVDLTDESFYVVSAYRFALGARPFIDELMLQQTASFLTTFPVKIYLFLNGGPNGLVLFTRYLYFFFSIILSFLVFKVLKNFLSRDVSILVALTCLAFIPFNIPNFSFNTLGWGFLTLGYFLGLKYVLGLSSPRLLFFSGLCHGLAVVSYPTMVLVGILYPFVLIFLTKEKKIFFFYYLGLLFPFTLIMPFFSGVKLEDIYLSLAYVLSGGVHTSSLNLERLAKVLDSFWSYYSYQFFLSALAVLTSLLFRSLKIFLPYLLLLFPLTIGFRTPLTASLEYVFFLALLSPLLFLFKREDKISQALFVSVCAPSFLAGLITAYTSSNGYVQAGLGAFPAALVTLIYLIWLYCKEIELKGYFLKFESFLKYFPLVIVLGTLLFFQLNAVYRDDTLNLLTKRVEGGGFKGLYTSKEKSLYLEKLSRDLKKICSREETIFFYDRFPGGYFLTNASPLTNTIWVWQIHSRPKAKREIIIDYFKMGKPPDVVVKIKLLFNSIQNKEKMTYPLGDVIDNYFKEESYKLVIAREEYEIYCHP